MIGADIVYIPEFKKQMELGGNTFMQKVFNESEIKNSKAEHLAGLWAAKEAVVKASDKPIRKLTDVKISSSKNGKPLASAKGSKFDISIAHDGDYAIAVAYRVGR
jgi:phosphopantetheine--protein transferase-like protein